ncbi:MAG: InlB B-repeat-containing protein [Alphaproteobacteria bacterium]|nr:InlB B-repeat-containing protein [Alphaproteobacteria bacterium]
MDDTYRRCICSSRISEIKQKQSTLTDASDSLTAFHDLNLDIINKSASEVGAMTSATSGENTLAGANDNSASVKQLNAISDVLSKTRTKSLSTAGTLDAGGDIKSIWATTDLANGANIANLTGESLFNAVNAQCTQMVNAQCPASILNMVVSAYGMYIENDCTALATNLTKQKNSANSAIRETGREMNIARLENYDAHNSLSINDCISNIRDDITAATACGPDFVHCLDVTGLYLNIDTGEPLYTKNFYNLANQISLSGNILSNQTNHMFVNTLNNKKIYAEKTLDKCRDLSGDVWDEFMRQAIIEIHQKQQEKIRTVKNECLGIVNQCYDEQTNSLKDFSNLKDKTLLGLTMETVEDLCREKLDTCSNLYGGGTSGLNELVNAMRDIVDQRIVAECQNLLTDFGTNLCSTQSSDTLHAYPYACRVYTPGDQQYAAIPKCNAATANSADCGNDYVDSLYQRFVHYAMQVCIRPSEYENYATTGELAVPTPVLQDINIVMDKMRISMGNELSRECERLGGIWVSTPYTNTSIALLEQFYTETGTNKNWGYCRTPNTNTETYVVTFDNKTNGNTNTFTAIVTFGQKMASVAKPTKTTVNGTSCIFGGYYSGENGTGTQYYNAAGTATRTWDIAGNTTLHAKWDNPDDNTTGCTNNIIRALN